MPESSLITESRIRCREIMSQKISSASAGTSLQQAARLLLDGDVGILPVVDGQQKLLGLVTDRDIVVRAVAEGADVTTTPVESIMTTDVHVAGPDDFVFEAVRTMGDRKVRRVPIVAPDGVLIGIVSLADIALEMEDETEIAAALEEISSGEGFWSKR